MTTGQGASYATWLLTEPARPAEAAAATRAPAGGCCARLAHVPAVAGSPPGGDAAPSMNRFSWRESGRRGEARSVNAGWMLRLELGVTVILPLLVVEAPDRESRERRDDSEVRAGWQQVFHGSSFARPEHRMNFHLRGGSQP